MVRRCLWSQTIAKCRNFNVFPNSQHLSKTSGTHKDECGHNFLRCNAILIFTNINSCVNKKVLLKPLNFSTTSYSCRELGDEVKRKTKTHVLGSYLRYPQGAHQNVWNLDKHWRLDKKTNKILNFYAYLQPFNI